MKKIFYGVVFKHGRNKKKKEITITAYDQLRYAKTKDIISVSKDVKDSSKDLIIKDAIQEALNYCNLKELPIELEPFIRKKVQGIINYEAENGTTSVFDIKSIKEGDTSITYNVDDKISKETIYGLSDKDKKSLQAFKRLRK